MKYLEILLIFIIPNILAQYIQDGRKINLEDIEHDNLLSEKLSHENDPLITQSTQHLRPPSILAVNPYLTHQSPGSIIYTSPNTEGEIHYAQPVHDEQKFHHHHHHPHQVQYLTQQQSPELLAEQNYNQQVYGTPAAVHEHDPTYTYTTISNRQSLLKPIIPTIATYLTPHQQQQQQQPEQPQYIYLPQGRSLNHRPQDIQQVVGGIQYVTNPPTSPIIYTHNDQELVNEQKVTDDQIIYHHHHPQPQQIPGSGATYLQYIPYVTRGSNNGQYIIMAPIPAGYGQPTPTTKPILSYSHPANPQQLVQYVPQAPNPIVGGIQYVTNNEIESAPESVQPHPHPVQIPYTPDYSNSFPKRPSKLYRFESSDQPNNNYHNSHSDENLQQNSQLNYGEEEKQTETTKLNSQIRQDENNEEDEFEPIKKVIPYTSKVQDIEYATPNSLTDDHNADNQEKSKQQLFAPEHPEKIEQLRTSKPAQNNQYFTPNRFSSFQSTTANPISQRYYASQKHITDFTKPNERHQHEQPTSSTQSWSNKVMPMQYQQYEPKYSTPTAISSANPFAIKQQSSTANPIKIQSTAFRSPIPKYYLPTPKTIQSTHRPTTTTFSITTNEQKHITSKQHQTESEQAHQQYQINSSPIPPPLPKFIQTIQQHQHQHEPINIDQTNTYTDSPKFTNNRQPKSLLESYIPSWVIVENQNKEREHLNRNTNSYNTISYSVSVKQVNGNHLKRSPTPTTVTSTKLIKI